jgi:phosphate transport system permease protein
MQGLRNQGLPAIWFAGTMTLVVLLLLGTMIGLVVVHGLRPFWPARLAAIEAEAGSWLGPIVGTEVVPAAAPGDRPRERLLLRIGNRDLYGLDFRWFDRAAVTAMTYPADAVLVERAEHGHFHGFLRAVRRGGTVVAEGPGAWEVLASEMKEAKRRARAPADPDARGGAESGLLALFATADGREKEIRLDAITRIYRPNAIGFAARARIYAARLWEFLSAPPRESNTEGGIFPALFGTLLMVLLMTVAVVPLGVIAALYLHEYAKHGPVLRAVRLAVGNLAGVPSIVFGMFGLAFFVYGVGGFLDRTFYADRLPNPTFGTGGLLWASLTLALLTLPVVIVATEEGLGAVPRANREGALALGATQWQTLRHVVLPNALPGILTGVILAVSRGAGEVAPLMLTGVVKLAPALAVDGQFPFVHLERKFMHLGFHVYDVSMQSPNVEAAKPMVYATTLLLLLLVMTLNAVAIVVRNRMRRRYRGAVL